MSAEADIQRAIDSNPANTTFCLASGVYRLVEPLEPKDGSTLAGTGINRTVLSGAVEVHAIQRDGVWVVTNQVPLGESRFTDVEEQCRPVEGRDPDGMCVWRDQVFLDDESLWQVASRSELSAGEFYWDYENDEIYLADDPSGRELEVGATTSAIVGGVGVTVRDLTVEKFGNGVQSGAISAGSRWTIDSVEARLNHGGGVGLGPGTVLRNSYIHHNGELGIAGGQARCAAAKGIVVENNEIAYNNTAGYNWTWEAGGSKWTYTNGLVVRGNFVHHNYGSGLWTDVSNVDTLYEDNRVEDNYGPGIIHEISYAAVIRDNVVRRNGFEHPVQGNVWSAGIHIAMSRDVEVYGNIVEDNAGGIAAIQTPAGDECGYGRQEVANLYVHDNVIRQPTGIAAGINVYLQTDQSYFETKNNRWENNRYTLGDPTQMQFLWNNQVMNPSLWRGFEHDMNGAFTGLDA